MDLTKISFLTYFKSEPILLELKINPRFELITPKSITPACLMFAIAISLFFFGFDFPCTGVRIGIGLLVRR